MGGGGPEWFGVGFGLVTVGGWWWLGVGDVCVWEGYVCSGYQLCHNKDDVVVVGIYSCGIL